MNLCRTMVTSVVVVAVLFLQDVGRADEQEEASEEEIRERLLEFGERLGEAMGRRLEAALRELFVSHEPDEGELDKGEASRWLATCRVLLPAGHPAAPDVAVNLLREGRTPFGRRAFGSVHDSPIPVENGQFTVRVWEGRYILHVLINDVAVEFPSFEVREHGDFPSVLRLPEGDVLVRLADRSSRPVGGAEIEVVDLRSGVVVRSRNPSRLLKTGGDGSVSVPFVPASGRARVSAMLGGREVASQLVELRPRSASEDRRPVQLRGVAGRLNVVVRRTGETESELKLANEDETVSLSMRAPERGTLRLWLPPGGWTIRLGSGERRSVEIPDGGDATVQFD